MTRSLVPSRLPKLIRSRPQCGFVRKAGLRTSSRQSAAQEFTMPAMSPTMTEGNIASWKVKEGDSYAAGDVLLEIETDKAQMDVEAQEDGIMAKIIEPSGSKGVKVGTRIGVVAEPGDDVSTLDLSALQSSKKDDTKEETKESSNGRDQPAASESKSSAREPGAEKTSSPEHTPGQATRNLKYPLYPSVIQLLHERGISEGESNKIPASGPSGRLLKGDILAYLGEINASYASDQSRRIEKLGHLDLSNIEIAPPPATSKPSAPKPAEEEKTRPTISEVALPISLAAVQSVRQRVKNVLGVEIPVETFIARATQLCNEDLPRSKNQAVSADELFDSVLGLDKVSPKPAGPVLIPQLQSWTVAAAPPSSKQPTWDIIDELSAGPRRASTRRTATQRAEIDPTVSLFSVSVATGDEKRAKVFLERLKTVLQVEPGKLVL